MKYDLKKVLLTIDLRAKNIKKELFVKYKDESSYTDVSVYNTAVSNKVFLVLKQN